MNAPVEIATKRNPAAIDEINTCCEDGARSPTRIRRPTTTTTDSTAQAAIVQMDVTGEANTSMLNASTPMRRNAGIAVAR